MTTCEFCNSGIKAGIKCCKCNCLAHDKCLTIVGNAFCMAIDKSKWLCKDCKKDDSSFGCMVSKTLLNEVTTLKKLICELERVNELQREKIALLESNSEKKEKKCDGHLNDSDFKNINENKLLNAKSKLIISSKTNSNDTYNELKKYIDPVTLGHGIVNIKKNENTNDVIIHVKDDISTQRIKSLFQENTNNRFNIKSSKPISFKPRLIIFNVIDKEFIDDEKLIKNILAQNDFGIENPHIKIIKRFTPKEKNYFNVIVEVNTETRAKILEHQRLFIGWSSCPVKEYFNVLKCFKCAAFGHIQSLCPVKHDVCPLCSLQHRREDCNSNFKRCANCVRANSNLSVKIDEKHTSFDKSCPIYLKKLEFIKSNTTDD